MWLLLNPPTAICQVAFAMTASKTGHVLLAIFIAIDHVECFNKGRGGNPSGNTWFRNSRKTIEGAVAPIMDGENGKKVSQVLRPLISCSAFNCNPSTIQEQRYIIWPRQLHLERSRPRTPSVKCKRMDRRSDLEIEISGCFRVIDDLNFLREFPC